MLLGFFDYKDANHVSEMFSIGHIIYMIVAIILLIIFPLKLRNIKHNKIDKYLKVLAIIIPISEVIKIIWETYYYYPIYGTFEYDGLLPLYLCSLFIYCLPLAAYSKGKAKDIALSFLTTVGIIGGISNVIYLNILNDYPLFHFASFVSIFYHLFMTFTGLWLLTSGYYKIDKYTPLKAMVPIILLSLIAIPMNIIFDADYMLLNYAYGLPLLPDLAILLKQNNLHFIFIIIMFIAYIIVGYIVLGINNLTLNIIKRQKNKI